MKRKDGKKPYRRIVAVSGGPDSVYLAYRSRKSGSGSLILAHYNHGARGDESDRDQALVERMSRALDLPLEVGKSEDAGKRRNKRNVSPGIRIPGFERLARESRYHFLREARDKHEAEKIVLAHTADDQVETVLMRVFEGAGISGLKGIPRNTDEGVERPLLDSWREDILTYLKKHDIPYRIDRSNLDTRFERNWIRHVLLPMLEKRYGKSVRKRIHTLGERFRELDVYIEESARKWLISNGVMSSKKRLPEQIFGSAVQFPRKAYARLPSMVRVRILQLLCFELVATSPNERLLGSMDRLIASGGPSGRLNIGKGATLRCRYGEATLSPPGEKAASRAGKGSSGRTGKGGAQKDRNDRSGEKAEKAGVKQGEYTGKREDVEEPFLLLDGPGLYEWKNTGREKGEFEAGSLVAFSWEERGKIAPARIRKLAGDRKRAAFDAKRLLLPLVVRRLRAGDKVRPFGLGASKKVKEILIDRKVPREERWGRPVVCDADGRIVWIPGVARSEDAPVTGRTRRTIVLRADARQETPTQRRVTSEVIHAKLKGESRRGRAHSYGV